MDAVAGPSVFRVGLARPKLRHRGEELPCTAPMERSWEGIQSTFAPERIGEQSPARCPVPTRTLVGCHRLLRLRRRGVCRDRVPKPEASSPATTRGIAALFFAAPRTGFRGLAVRKTDPRS